MSRNTGPSAVTSESHQQKVVLQNSCGDKLVGILHETGCKELVIICHGFGSSKERIPMVSIATELENEGISAFRFDFSGHGESEGKFQPETYDKEVDDLHLIIQHFTKSQRTVAAIAGHSRGGNAVLFYASKYSDVPTVVNISGCFSLENRIDAGVRKGHLQKVRQNGYIEVKNRRGKFLYRLTLENLMERLNSTRNSALSISKDCRVLTVHGSKDDDVSPDDALEFSKLISNHELHIIEGGDHEFTLHQKELTSVVISFIKAGLLQQKEKCEPSSSRSRI